MSVLTRFCDRLMHPPGDALEYSYDVCNRGCYLPLPGKLMYENTDYESTTQEQPVNYWEYGVLRTYPPLQALPYYDTSIHHYFVVVKS